MSVNGGVEDARDRLQLSNEVRINFAKIDTLSWHGHPCHTGDNDARHPSGGPCLHGCRWLSGQRIGSRLIYNFTG